MHCPHCTSHPHPPWHSTLTADAPEAEYSRDTKTNVLHFGQLKLLCSEIQFLQHAGDWKGCTLIYAGASPGTHLPVLMSMFRGLRFVLIDPHRSAVGRGSRRVRILRACMTDELARRLARQYGERVLFVSDVRVAGPRHETEDEHQARIERDMDAQMRWHGILNPRASLLKFRLPWNRPHTEYLAGTLFLPVFGKRLTHEARLFVPRGAGTIQYDNEKYQRQMAYFNQVTRHARHPGGMCFDCYSLFRLLGEDAPGVVGELGALCGRRDLI
jgi:hypothetical protein